MLAESDLGRWLRTVQAGTPACIFTDDVGDARDTLEQLVTSESEPARVVALSWDDVPALGNELRLLVDALARATFELFPSLYGFAQEPRERWTETDVESEAHGIARQVPEVLGAACREILLSCRRGRLPIVRKLPNGELVRQLALAIEPHRLVVLIAVLNASVTGVRLRALAQGAEWLASNTRSRVVLVLPRAFSATTELDHVTHAACSFAQVGDMRPRSPTNGAAFAAPNAKAEPVDDRPRVFVSAVAGRPHPKSDAEIELHRRLTSDPELCPLFAYNQPVWTRFESRPTVDLVWEAGRLVIEIDGDDHRGVQKFSQDRRRDYELMLSGYQVVRFTRSKVIEDADTVVHQIREAVRFFSRREMER